MGNRSKRKRIAGLRLILAEHRQKIAREQSVDFPRWELVEHWTKEIETFEREIMRTERQLTKHRRKRRRDSNGSSKTAP